MAVNTQKGKNTILKFKFQVSFYLNSNYQPLNKENEVTIAEITN